MNIERISSFLPFNIAKFKIATPQQMLNNAKKVSGIAVAMFAFSYAFLDANAGPLAYAACVAECSALTLGGFIPLCLAGCVPFLTAPTP